METVKPQTKVQLTKQALEKMTPSQLAVAAENKFVQIYETFHGKNGKVFYEQEKYHFTKLINDNKVLQQCSKLSLFGAFMDAAVNGLSFDPSMKHCYLVPFNTNVGTKKEPKWEKRVTLMISGYGELLMRQQGGQIKYADNPVLVYEGDEFSFGSANGSYNVTHKACFPRKSSNIIAAYLRITRADDTIDYKVMTIDEIERLKRFSKDPDSKAWTDGLPGMIQTKLIKHSFRNYPKFRMGQMATKLQTKLEDEVIDYGLAEEVAPEENQEAASDGVQSPAEAADQQGSDAPPAPEATGNGTVTMDDPNF